MHRFCQDGVDLGLDEALPVFTATAYRKQVRAPGSGIQIAMVSGPAQPARMKRERGEE